ncbi:MAG: hypothetical protein SCH68_09135 [Brevefilum sp.]|nr:hypothetical protein [Brevefilum sp.]
MIAPPLPNQHSSKVRFSTGLDLCRELQLVHVTQVLVFKPRNLHVDVDPVQQQRGETKLVSLVLIAFYKACETGMN